MTAETLSIHARPHALAAPIGLGTVPVGLTLRGIVAEVYRRGRVPPALRTGALVLVDGEAVPEAWWDLVRPKPAANIVISVGLGAGSGSGGQKNPLATILSLAVIVASLWAGSELALALGFAANGSAAAVATFALATIGTYAVSALFPAKTATSGITHNNYALSGSQNAVSKWSPVPVVLGTVKVTPPLGAETYTELVGDDVYLRMLVVWGYGPLKIDQIKIGDTLLSKYADYEIETREGRPDDAPITLYPGEVWEQNLSVTVKAADGWVIHTTHTETDEIQVEIAFGAGLFRYDDDGDQQPYAVSVLVEYAPTGVDAWTATAGFAVDECYVGALRKGLAWKVPTRGQYDVRMKRVTPDTDDSKITDDVTWYALRSLKAEYPLRFPKPLALTALRIKASDQLNGMISNLNALVTSYLPTWDGEAWTEAATNNPASLLRAVLTGPANYRARSADQIDDASMAAFAAFCATAGYAYNKVVTEQTSVFAQAAEICAAGRGAPTLVDGKWGVIIDAADKPVVQCFTPRNTWNYELEKTFIDLPHALRIKFNNQANDFIEDERIVYGDGWDEDTATDFESFAIEGLTDTDLVWKFGRYHLAQAKLRPETHRFCVGIEHVVCRRGDLIRVAHDVPAWGTGWGRVKALIVSADQTTGVILDDGVIFEAGSIYAARFRRADGSNIAISITNPAEMSATLIFAVAIPTATGPGVGDLAMVGIANRESETLLIAKITPAADLTATIEAVEAAPEIYQADTGAIPAFATNITETLDPPLRLPPVPVITGTESGVSALLPDAVGGYACRILVGVHAGTGAPAAVSYTLRWREITSSAWTETTAPATATTLIATGVKQGATYRCQVKGTSDYGRSSDWSAAVAVTVIGNDAPPGRPTGLTATGGLRQIQLDWVAPSDRDIDYYVVLEALTDAVADAREIKRTPDTTYIRGGLGALATRYYWVYATDKVGNKGAVNATAGTPGTTTYIEMTDIPDRFVETSMLAPDLAAKVLSVDDLATSYTNLALNQDQTSTALAVVREDVEASATQTTAIAARVDTVTTTLAGQAATVQTMAQSVDGVKGMWTTKVELGGDGRAYVAGIGLMADLIDGKPASEIILEASRVAIGVLDGAGTPTYPFIVETIAGVPAIYMNAALIRTATIETLHLKDQAVVTQVFATAPDAVEITGWSPSLCAVTIPGNDTGGTRADSLFASFQLASFDAGKAWCNACHIRLVDEMGVVIAFSSLRADKNDEVVIDGVACYATGMGSISGACITQNSDAKIYYLQVQRDTTDIIENVRVINSKLVGWSAKR